MNAEFPREPGLLETELPLQLKIGFKNKVLGKSKSHSAFDQKGWSDTLRPGSVSQSCERWKGHTGQRHTDKPRREAWVAEGGLLPGRKGWGCYGLNVCVLSKFIG